MKGIPRVICYCPCKWGVANSLDKLDSYQSECMDVDSGNLKQDATFECDLEQC